MSRTGWNSHMVSFSCPGIRYNDK